MTVGKCERSTKGVLTISVTHQEKMTTSTASPSRRGSERKQAVIEAAAAILRENGPTAVTHRAVARRANSSLSATTYYFEGLSDLLSQAARANTSRWASRAERVAERAESLHGNITDEMLINLLLEASIPDDENLQAHYSQLISAGDSELVCSAYRTGRSRLNAAVARILACRNISLDVDLIIGMVDGAAVSALSEGHDVHDAIRRLLHSLLTTAGHSPAQEDNTKSVVHTK